MNIGKDKNCSLGGDMLAYLYNEMPAADRESFELHLVDCGTCIDDFAELSQSRYPVFEWKASEFDMLPTPRVVIPFAETVSVSWTGRLKAAFSFNPGMAMGGSFAALVLAALVGYSFLSNGSTPHEIAGTTAAVESPIPVVPANSPELASRDESKVEESKPDTSSDTLADAAESRRSKAVQPDRTRRSVKAIPVKATKATRPERRRNLNVPTLSRVEDDEDDSLRLADIFDEIGTSE